MVVNHAKFQILLLGSKFDNTSIKVMIKKKQVNSEKTSNYLELLSMINDRWINLLGNLAIIQAVT